MIQYFLNYKYSSLDVNELYNKREKLSHEYLNWVIFYLKGFPNLQRNAINLWPNIHGIDIFVSSMSVEEFSEMWKKNSTIDGAHEVKKPEIYWNFKTKN